MEPKSKACKERRQECAGRLEQEREEEEEKVKEEEEEYSITRGGKRR